MTSIGSSIRRSTAQPSRWLWRGLITMIGAGVLGMGLIGYAGSQDHLQPADLALVLGSKVELDGQPSRGLRARLERAAQLYFQGYFPLMVVSGGVGKEGHDEAEVMKAYLMGKGIPAERILTDHTGNNTYASAQNLRRLAQERQVQRIMVISQYFHIPRSRLALERVGFADVRSAHAHLMQVNDIVALGREVVAYLYYATRSYEAPAS